MPFNGNSIIASRDFYKNLAGILINSHGIFIKTSYVWTQLIGLTAYELTRDFQSDDIVPIRHGIFIHLREFHRKVKLMIDIRLLDEVIEGFSEYASQCDARAAEALQDRDAFKNGLYTGQAMSFRHVAGFLTGYLSVFRTE